MGSDDKLLRGTDGTNGHHRQEDGCQLLRNNGVLATIDRVAGYSIRIVGSGSNLVNDQHNSHKEGPAYKAFEELLKGWGGKG